MTPANLTRQTTPLQEAADSLPIAGDGREESAYRAGPLDTSMLPADLGEPLASVPPGSIGRKLAGATMIVGGAFALSRVLGLVRNEVIAAQFPPSPTDARLDTYLAAFNLPDTLFLLIIGGAVGSAFIPVFTDLMEQKKVAQAWRLTSTLINASVVLLALGGIILAFFAPVLVGSLLVPDWSPQKQADTVALMRIMLLSPLFLGLGGWAQGILNARQSFTLPALAPLAYNGAIIGGALLLAPRWGTPGLAVGVVIGSLFHFLVQVPGLIRVGMRYHPFHFNAHDEGARRVATLMLPRIVGQAAFQANILFITNVASFLPGNGGYAAFNYAYILMMLPHGVLAMSLATVLFPTMTAQVSRGDLPAMRATLVGGIRILVFLVLPMAVILGLLRRQIVALLFEFGAFRQGSVDLVAPALGWFAWGLLAYVVVELVTRGYYALQDTRTPVVVSIATVVFNIILSRVLVLGFGMDQSGLALSLSLTTTLEMLGLLYFLRRRLPGLFDRPALRAFAVSLLGAGLMGGALFFLVPWLDTNIWAYPSDALGTKVATALVFGIAVLVGGAIYLGVARLLHADELGRTLRLLRRGAR